MADRDQKRERENYIGKCKSTGGDYNYFRRLMISF